MQIVKKGVEKSDDSLKNVTGGYVPVFLPDLFNDTVYRFSSDECKIIEEKTGKSIQPYECYTGKKLNNILGFNCSDFSEMRGKLYEEFGFSASSHMER